MLKNTIRILVIISAFIIIGYVLYRHFLPNIIARQLTQNREASILPEKLKTKINKVKKPMNELSGELIQSIHENNITLDKILSAIDKMDESEAYALLDEINSLGRIENHDILFNLIKEKKLVDFDVEVFREPFKQKVDIKLIRKTLQYANNYRDNELLDFETAKLIAKQILKEKEREFEAKAQPTIKR